MLCRQCRRARLAGGTRGEHGLGVGERCKQPPPMQQPAPWRREPPLPAHKAHCQGRSLPAWAGTSPMAPSPCLSFPP